jgi:ABC-type nitrate/sulfonate/bicarbonate transport system ATPase subunit
VIEIRGLRFSYSKAESPIFSNLNLHIDEGSKVSLVGPSGSGKSTLLKIIGGLLKPTEVSRFYVKSPLGWVFQEPRLVPWLSIKENLLLALKRPGIGDRLSVDLSSFLDLTQLSSDILVKFPHQLSGGQKMRVSLTRALLVKPKILLLDEALSALDEDLRSELQEQILNLHKKFKFTLLTVTHSLEEALVLSDRILMLSKQGGHIKEFQPIENSLSPLSQLRLQFKSLREMTESS